MKHPARMLLLITLLLAGAARADGIWIPTNSWGARILAVNYEMGSLHVTLEGNPVDYTYSDWNNPKEAMFAALLDAQKNRTLITLYVDEDQRQFYGARFIVEPPTSVGRAAGTATPYAAAGTFDALGRNRSAAKGRAFRYLLPAPRK